MVNITLLMVSLLFMTVNSYDCAQKDDGILFGQKCQSQGGQCVDIFSGLVDRPVCVLFKGCRYDFKKKGCVDNFNLCQKKKGCCLPVAQSIKDGIPICKCVSQPTGSKCPNCLDHLGNGECFDIHRTCTERGGCCDLQKWPTGSSDPKFWPVCTCRKREDNQKNCQTCVFNKFKAACDDVNNECKKQGKCCQIKVNSFSSITGLPTCECVSLRRCPNCQRKQPGAKCFDQNQVCQSQGLCCQLDKTFSGVQYCNCRGCPSNDCKYDKSVKQCIGKCISSDAPCCQFNGKFDINKQPVCKCKKATNQVCDNSCQWNKLAQSCIDTTGKCQNTINKCCKIDQSGSICGCKTCQSESKCVYNQKSQLCLKNGCPQDDRHTCLKLTDATGKIICRCVEIRSDDPIFVETPAQSIEKKLRP